MEALRELARYLWRRGLLEELEGLRAVLGPEAVEELEAWKRSSVYEEELEFPDEPSEREVRPAHVPQLDAEDELEPAPPRRGRGSRRPRRGTPGIRDLAAQIEERTSHWLAATQRRLGPIEAALLAPGCSLREELLRRGLHDGEGLAGLCDALLRWDPLGSESPAGKAAVACHRLFATTELSGAQAYAWVLARTPIARAWHLHRALHGLWRELDRTLQADPDRQARLLGALPHGDGDDFRYAFVLVRGARAFARTGALPRCDQIRAHEVSVLLDKGLFSIDAAVTAAALAMEPDAVPALLERLLERDALGGIDRFEIRPGTIEVVLRPEPLPSKRSAEWLKLHTESHRVLESAPASEDAGAVSVVEHRYQGAPARLDRDPRGFKIWTQHEHEFRLYPDSQSRRLELRFVGGPLAGREHRIVVPPALWEELPRGLHRLTRAFEWRVLLSPRGGMIYAEWPQASPALVARRQGRSHVCALVAPGCHAFSEGGNELLYMESDGFRFVAIQDDGELRERRAHLGWQPNWLRATDLSGHGAVLLAAREWRWGDSHHRVAVLDAASLKVLADREYVVGSLRMPRAWGPPSVAEPYLPKVRPCSNNP